MKSMKGLAVIATAAALWVGLSACADDGGSSGSSGSGVETVIQYDTAGTASVPEIAVNTIVRNKVVKYNDVSAATETYYEYLTFTSDTEGSYALYKEENDTKTQVTTYESAGVTLSYPTTFTYDKASGKVTCNANSVYFIESGSDKVIAKEILTTESSTIALLDTVWKNSAGSTSYTFDNTGFVYINGMSGEYGYPFTNTNGWIIIGSSTDEKKQIPLLWAAQGDTKKLYLAAYKTERENVEEAGRSISSDEIYTLFSDDFLFIK